MPNREQESCVLKKLGIKGRVLLLTLLPTSLMALVLGGYFTWMITDVASTPTSAVSRRVSMSSSNSSSMVFLPRNRLDTYLSRAGFQVRTTPDGAGFRQALENDYAVIILDVMLPGLDGYGVLDA